MTKSEWGVNALCPLGCASNLWVKLNLYWAPASQNWLKHLREFMSLKWLAISLSLKSNHWPSTKTTNTNTRASSWLFTVHCPVSIKWSRETASSFALFMGLVAWLYGCHVPNLLAWKLIRFNEIFGLQVFKPASRLHSFFMQLTLPNKTNLHFNMLYVNLEFKIPAQNTQKQTR